MINKLPLDLQREKQNGKGIKSRLIELVNESTGAVYNGDIIVKEEVDITEEEIERIVDQLLANGVTIPVRCKYCLHYDLIYPEKKIGEEAQEVHYCLLRKSTVRPDGFCDSGAEKE